mmetsp:Transcript_110158/g.200368  ORF Transcript_110158/g.200368 Transcript_110158/m.200368 type:complete len:91 (-) Transcript_110158:18-290(-)
MPGRCCKQLLLLRNQRCCNCHHETDGPNISLSWQMRRKRRDVPREQGWYMLQYLHSIASSFPEIVPLRKTNIQDGGKNCKWLVGNCNGGQ